MPERSFSSPSYRYGFNGMEKDDEVYNSSGSFYDLGLRCYNSRLGRMFSIDPRANEYPWQTTYAYHRNSPIWKLDYLGGGDLPPFRSSSNLITDRYDKAYIRITTNRGVKMQTLADFPPSPKVSTSFGYQTNGGFLADKRGDSRIVDVFKAETKLTVTERREDYENYHVEIVTYTYTETLTHVVMNEDGSAIDHVEFSTITYIEESGDKYSDYGIKTPKVNYFNDKSGVAMVGGEIPSDKLEDDLSNFVDKMKVENQEAKARSAGQAAVESAIKLKEESSKVGGDPNAKMYQTGQNVDQKK